MSTTVNSIMNIQRQRKQRRMKIYKDTYNKVRMRIEHYLRFGHMSCTYTIPQIIYGAPHIDKTEIANYLENKLRTEDGFGVYRIDPTTLYISWEETILKEQEKQNKERKLLKDKQEEIERMEEERNLDLLKAIANV